MRNKKQRIAELSAILASNPNKVYPLVYFERMFGVAKSSVSEDVAVVREAFADLGAGKIVTVPGVNGGVKFVPGAADGAKEAITCELIAKMSDTSRILPGGYMFVADIFCTPSYVDGMAGIMAGWFRGLGADCIVTVETMGIPLAMSVARILNLPVAVARRESRLTDGSVFSIHYLSGASRRLKTMSLSKRMMREGSRVVVIDDFIAGGGTIKAIYDMLDEFSIKVAGTGVAIVNKYPQKKKIKDYKALFVLEEMSETHIEIRRF